MDDKSLLIKSNIINIDDNIKNVSLNLEIPNLIGNINLLLGVVKDSYDCRPIQGMTISITNVENKEIYMNAITNSYGEYYICNIPQGYYKINIQKDNCSYSYNYLLITERLINIYNVCI